MPQPSSVFELLSTPAGDDRMTTIFSEQAMLEAAREKQSNVH